MEEAWGVGGLDEGEMHTRIDWSCRALGSAFLGSPSQSPFFPQRATDAGTVSRVRNFVMFLLIVGWKLSLPSVALCMSLRRKGQCTGQRWEMGPEDPE